MNVRITEATVVVDNTDRADYPRARIAQVIAFARSRGPEFEDAAFTFDLDGVDVTVTENSDPEQVFAAWQRDLAPVEPADHSTETGPDDGDAPSYP